MSLMIALALLASAPSQVAQRTQAESWDPAATRALVIGVLRWEDPSLATWPDAGRSDAVLVETLAKRGIPKDRINFLRNEAAGKKACMNALDAALKASRAGETLIFYYAGHGAREDGTTSFLPYDNLSGGSLSVREIGKRMAAGFKGSLVILLADCCYSGGLVEAADMIEKSGKAALVLASVVSSSTSTGAWTFTDSLIDIFAGRIAGDLSDTGIGYDAAAAYVLENMKIADRQLACAYRTPSFPVNFSLALSSTTLVPARPVYREAFDGKDWFPARILKIDGRKALVHYVGFDDEWDEWLESDRLRLPEFAAFKKSTLVMVEWSGEWYPAKVLDVKDGFHLVTYDGYGPEWDEWVSSPRIKKR